jgi:hypothetical protein
MQRRMWLVVFLCAIFATGCVGPKRGLFPADNSKTVYVLHRDLHTPLVVRRADIPTNTWPSHTVLPKTEFIEIGWGDNEGYRFEWTFRIVTRALFWPTPSVIFMQGFDEPVIDHFSEQAREIIEVKLSDEGFARMCPYFEDAFQLDEQGQPIPLGDDFFVARGNYHIFQNSNHWAAKALREAGCPITSFYANNANNVMLQTRRFGRVVWKK